MSLPPGFAPVVVVPVLVGTILAYAASFDALRGMRLRRGTKIFVHLVTCALGAVCGYLWGQS